MAYKTGPEFLNFTLVDTHFRNKSKTVPIAQNFSKLRKVVFMRRLLISLKLTLIASKMYHDTELIVSNNISNILIFFQLECKNCPVYHKSVAISPYVTELA